MHEINFWEVCIMGTLSKDEKVARYDAQKAKEKRYWVKQAIMLKKAQAAGIKVTEAEIDDYIKARK